MEAAGSSKKPAAAPAWAPLRPGVAAAVVRESPLDDTASSAVPKCAVAGGGSVPQPRGHVVAPETLGLRSESTMVRDFLRFKSSAAPSRVLFYAGGRWTDFPPSVVELLKEGFLAGRALMDVKVGDSLFLFDFARMLQIDAATNGRSSIAWIDVNGRCFFPGAFTEANVVHPKIDLTVRAGENGGTAALAGERNEGGYLSQDRVGGRLGEGQVVPAGSLERQRWPGAQVLAEGGMMYKIIDATFLNGMRKYLPQTTITSISQCSYMGLSANGRLKAFMAQLEMTKSARGDAHIKTGWYGASASNITSIISHGFGQPNNGSLGPGFQAIGVYLSVGDCPHASSLLAEADNVGEKHVILCRIITGNVEKVNDCRPQCHPSTDEFDCGVDDLEKPKWYVVWGTHMNTHILPEYIVSFKTFASGPPVMETTGKQLHKIPLPPVNIFAESGNSLPPSKVQALEILLKQVKAEKIPKDIFRRKLREIVGEKLLATMLQKDRKGVL